MEFIQRPLDADLIADLLGRSDAIGFLTLYVDADPAVQSHPRPAWKIAVANDLREQAAMTDDTERARSETVHRRLTEAQSALEHRLDASAPGRGRAWFVPLSAEDGIEVAVQTPWPTLVRIEERPYVWPLVQALERNGPVGVVPVSADEVRILELSGGTIEEVHRIDARPATEDWRRMQGPAAANPGLAQQTAPQHDRYERRDRVVRQQDLGEYAEVVGALGRERGWHRVIVAGDPRFAHAVAEPLRATGLSVLEDARVLTGSPKAIQDALAGVVERAERDERERLAERVRAAAAADAAAVTDLAQTRAAIADGRVHHLMIEPQSGVDTAEELIERALASGARVTVFDHGELGTPDGVGALLRW